MAVYELTEAELDAVNGGVIYQRNVSVQLAANVAIRSNLSTTANANAYFGGTANASAQGGQAVVQDSSQSNNVSF